MTTTMITILLTVVKWIFGKQDQRSLNEKELLKHIEEHQKKYMNKGKVAVAVEDSMAELKARVAKKKDE